LYYATQAAGYFHDRLLIFMTGYARHVPPQDACVLRKPFRAGELVNAVIHTLEASCDGIVSRVDGRMVASSRRHASCPVQRA
jgi:hypothetical protein